MKKFKEALLAYLAATDAKQTQVALDAMTAGIKADIIQVIEETLAETQSGNEGKSLNLANNRVNLAAQNLLTELNVQSTDSKQWVC